MTGCNEFQARVVEDIRLERVRQDVKFGENNDYIPERWIVILAEEFGEVSNALLEGDMDNYYAELVQVAAVAVAAAECHLRQQGRYRWTTNT